MAVVALALALRLVRLDAQELWLDEVLSVAKATNPAWLGLPALRENTPPLYYLLLRAWVAIAGTSEEAVRLLSALLGTGFVAAVLWLGRELFDRRVALWAGLAAAVSPLHVYYSQEARAYVLLTLAVLLVGATLWRALRLDTGRAWVLFGAAALTALYSHYSALLALLPTAYLVWRWPGPPPAAQRWRRYGAALGAAILLFLPWAFAKARLASGAGPGVDWWVPDLWARTPPMLAIPRSLEVFGLGSQAGLLPIAFKQYTTLAFPGPLRALGLAGLGAAGLSVAVPWGDARLGLPGVALRKAWLGLQLALPLVLLWLASALGKPIYLAGRYDQVAFPPVPLLLGLALAKAQAAPQRGWLAAGILALALLGPAAGKLVLYFEAPGGGPARASAGVLHARVATGDLAILTGSRGFQVAYALTRLGYRRTAGVCRSAAGDRWFGCTLFPGRREAVFEPLEVRDVSVRSPARDEVSALVSRLQPHGGTLWVTFEGGVFLEGEEQFILPEPEATLVDELGRLGFRPVPLPGAPGVFRFRRATP